MKERPMKRAVLLTCLLACLFPACGSHELFRDANTSSNARRIEVYYDGDSAVQTRENRQRTAEMGFGYPTGAFQ